MTQKTDLILNLPTTIIIAALEWIANQQQHV